MNDFFLSTPNFKGIHSFIPFIHLLFVEEAFPVLLRIRNTRIRKSSRMMELKSGGGLLNRWIFPDFDQKGGMFKQGTESYRNRHPNPNPSSNTRLNPFLATLTLVLTALFKCWKVAALLPWTATCTMIFCLFQWRCDEPPVALICPVFDPFFHSAWENGANQIWAGQ